MVDHIFGLNPTKSLPKPTYYAEALNGEFSEWAYCEERSQLFKGHWREKAFGVSEDQPMDLEIGTGNGFHFAHYAKENPERSLVGLEIKYKPLVQSIRRAVLNGSNNMRIGRFHASYLDQIFAENELDHVIIHHPDPWPKKRQWKRRLIQDDFLHLLHRLQRPGGRIDFKTDDLSYFEWALERFQRSDYVGLEFTYDLHHSKFAAENFKTHFEQIFLAKSQPIYFLRTFHS